MRGIRRLFTLLILAGQLVLIYWRVRGRVAPLLPYIRAALRVRPQVQQALHELQQINNSIKH